MPCGFTSQIPASSTAEQSSFFDRTKKKKQQQKRKSCSSSMPSRVETKGSSPQGGREYSMPPLGHETCAAKVKPCQLAAVTGGSAPQAFLDNVKHNASAGSSLHQVVNFPPAGGIIVRLLCSSLQMNKTPFLLFCWNHINGRADRQGQRRGSFECQIAARSALFGWPLKKFFFAL